MRTKLTQKNKIQIKAQNVIISKKDLYLLMYLFIFRFKGESELFQKSEDKNVCEYSTNCNLNHLSGPCGSPQVI